MPKQTLADRLAADVFAMDMAGLRALAGSVLKAVLNGGRVTVDFGPDLYLLPWPHDDAADALAAWKAA